jgi:hypothetical protein
MLHVHCNMCQKIRKFHFVREDCTCITARVSRHVHVMSAFEVVDGNVEVSIFDI